jgi:uncharacterized repeat protein (TIGR03803 family)
MFRRVLSYSPMMLLALCLVPATAVARTDACSPTKPSPMNTNVNIPDVGNPTTPLSGVADGWVLLYEDSSFQVLSDEVYCQGNAIQFASSVGETNFNPNPDCTTLTCTKAVETGSASTVVLRGRFGNFNTFLWSGDVARFTVIHAFTGIDGAFPVAKLILDAAGTLYGTTALGGASNSGTLFKLDTSGRGTVLYNFRGMTDGNTPRGGLVLGSTGILYGTTVNGGTAWQGVVFKLDTSRGETVLHNFTNWPRDGAYPYGGLVRDSAGNFYGTTQAGGSLGYGTVFKMDGNNVVTMLHSFTNRDGANPLYETLLMDGSGNLYGTTYAGGNLNCNAPYGCGTVFRVDPSGTETVLHIFAGGTTDGCKPFGGVATDRSGNLYGTTESCGTGGGGTVWKVSLTTEAVLYNFTNGTDGGHPIAGVVLDNSGNVYGVTQYGGASGKGTIFKVDTNGRETVLHSFTSSSDGANPIGGLLLDPNNNLYGTASQGGSSGYGTVWSFHLQ